MIDLGTEPWELSLFHQPSVEFFQVQDVPVGKLDALIFDAHMRGHEVVCITSERHGITNSYRYTVIFERKPPPQEPDSPFTVKEF